MCAMAWGYSIHVDMQQCGDQIPCYLSPEESSSGRIILNDFSEKLISLIDMERYGPPLIEWFGKQGCEGYSLVQLITTSCLTIHTTRDNRVYLDLFSCKPYSETEVMEFCRYFFRPGKISHHYITRE